MNRPFRPASILSNALAAAAAVVSSILILGAIGGLAEHYSSQVQVAQAGGSFARAVAAPGA